jgi:phosphatidylglycerophosphate synthase
MGGIARPEQGAYAPAMLDPILRRLCERPLARTGAALATRVSANTSTVAGFAAGIIAPVLVVADLPLVALVFLVLGRVADIVDGAIARASRSTALGSFLDTSLDLIAWAALPVAFAIRDPLSGLAAAFFLFGFVAMTALELSLQFLLRERAPTAPLIGHTELLVVFAIACVYPLSFPLLCYIGGAVCFIAAGVRLANAVANLDSPEP